MEADGTTGWSLCSNCAQGTRVIWRMSGLGVPVGFATQSSALNLISRPTGVDSVACREYFFHEHG
jgi:hypothetical protein